MSAVENCEMLVLDARRSGLVPEVWCVLTTRTPTLDLKPFVRGRKQVMRALRRRWPDCEYVALLEYTKGYAERSGGRRRPHWNVLFKGIPRADIDRASEVIKRVWCEHADARPQAQYVGNVGEGVAGLIRYVAEHFHKEDQTPPPGFKGKRFNPSRGYWNGDFTTEQMRALARFSLQRQAAERQAQEQGLHGPAAAEWVAERLEALDELDWTAIQLSEDRWGEPLITVLGGEPLDIDRGSGLAQKLGAGR
jgi:hypothetical protein